MVAVARTAADLLFFVGTVSARTAVSEQTTDSSPTFGRLRPPVGALRSAWNAPWAAIWDGRATPATTSAGADAGSGPVPFVQGLTPPSCQAPGMKLVTESRDVIDLNATPLHLGLGSRALAVDGFGWDAHGLEASATAVAEDGAEARCLRLSRTSASWRLCFVGEC